MRLEYEGTSRRITDRGPTASLAVTYARGLAQASLGERPGDARPRDADKGGLAALRTTGSAIVDRSLDAAARRFATTRLARVRGGGTHARDANAPQLCVARLDGARICIIGAGLRRPEALAGST